MARAASRDNLAALASRKGDVSNLSLSRHCDRIESGDVLLFRPGRSPLARLISAAGRGDYSHAAVAAWWGYDLFCLEVREWHGGRAVLLSHEVARRPGLIDVYRLRPQTKCNCRPIATCRQIQGAVRKMLRFAGSRYGYWSVLRTALYHLPIVRMCIKPLTDDRMENGRPPYCSQAVAYAYRVGAGIDLVPNAADCVTEPADLARSALLEYQFTLWP